MPGPPKRPSKKRPTPPKPTPVPAGLPSSQHSDINTIVNSIIPDTSADPNEVELAELAQNPWNPRYGYDDPEVQSLAESLDLHGQIDRITIMPTALFLTYFPEYAIDKEVAGSHWVITDGNRRYAAATRAEWPKLRVSVAHTLIESAVEVRESVLVRTIHHEALPPLLEARELAALVEEYGSQTAVAHRLRRTQGWVSQRLALLKLDDRVQRDLSAGRVTLEQARAVTKVPKAEQRAALQQLRAVSREVVADARGDHTEHDHGDATVGTGAAGDEQRPERSHARTKPPAMHIRVAGETVSALAADLRTKLTAAQLRELVDILSE